MIGEKDTRKIQLLLWSSDDHNKKEAHQMANNDLLVLNELTESGGSLRPSIQVERALAEIKDTFQTSPLAKIPFTEIAALGGSFAGVAQTIATPAAEGLYRMSACGTNSNETDVECHCEAAESGVFGGTASKMHPSPVKEGKIEVIADCDGLLKVDSEKLKKVNSFGEMMIATRHGNTTVKKGDKLAGTRIIPLVIKKDKLEAASHICDDGPILDIKPFVVRKAAIITTGNEVYHGRIQDAFTPVIEKKIAEFGAQMMFHEVFDDDDQKITDGCLRAIEAGAEIVFCTGGMSVDPDDKTPLAIKNTGARVVSYGSPVLPGAMFLLSYYDAGDRLVPICGLPGCAMYNKRTIFDIVLPRLMACDMILADELAGLGEGGLCLNCDVCTFPNCGFGKGF